MLCIKKWKFQGNLSNAAHSNLKWRIHHYVKNDYFQQNYKHIFSWGFFFHTNKYYGAFLLTTTLQYQWKIHIWIINISRNEIFSLHKDFNKTRWDSMFLRNWLVSVMPIFNNFHFMKFSNLMNELNNNIYCHTINKLLDKFWHCESKDHVTKQCSIILGIYVSLFFNSWLMIYEWGSLISIVFDLNVIEFASFIND